MKTCHLVVYELVILSVIVLTLFMIFSLSSQDSVESSSLSYEVTDVVVRIVKPQTEINRTESWYQLDHNIVRQCAHASEYAFLGFMIMLAFAPFGFNVWLKIIISVALCLICSMLDEWNQSFVAGRGSELIDVLTDVGGACLGVCASLVVRKIALLIAEKGAFWRLHKTK